VESVDVVQSVKMNAKGVKAVIDEDERRVHSAAPMAVWRREKKTARPCTLCKLSQKISKFSCNCLK
jgi:hypothetical protein